MLGLLGLGWVGTRGIAAQTVPGVAAAAHSQEQGDCDRAAAELGAR